MDKIFKRKDAVQPANQDPEQPADNKKEEETLHVDQKPETQEYGTFDDKETPSEAKHKNAFIFGDETIVERVKQFVAEFIGLFIFVFIGSLSGLGNSGNLAGIAAAHGFTIALLIMAMGHISGGHFNPAVTVGLLTFQKISVLGAVMYIAAQLTGGIFGALAVRAVTNSKAYALVGGGVVGFTNANANMGQAVLSETILTFVLVLTVFMTAVDRTDNLLAPLAIGLAVFVDILAGANVSGASMNPARSFGPAIVYAGFGSAGNATAPDPNAVLQSHWVHWVGPLLGGILAGLVYRFAFSLGKKTEE